MQNLDSHAVNINQPRLVGKTDILKTPVVAAGTAVVVISEQHTVKLDPAVFNVIAFDRLGLLRLGSDNRLKVKIRRIRNIVRQHQNQTPVADLSHFFIRHTVAVNQNHRLVLLGRQQHISFPVNGHFADNLKFFFLGIGNRYRRTVQHAVHGRTHIFRFKEIFAVSFQICHAVADISRQNLIGFKFPFGNILRLHQLQISVIIVYGV